MNAKMLATLALGGGLILSCCAQGTFQNLDFESATVGADPTPRTVPFSSAFPGWTGTINGQAQMAALYNDLVLIGGSFALLGPTSGVNPIPGSFTAVLEAQPIFSPISVSLFQSGTVPSDAHSLRFFATTLSLTPDFVVSLNGTPLSLSVIRPFGAYDLYGADVSAFAGQSAELRFDITGSPPQGRNLYLDNILFSPVAIPEPSIWALLALGSALLWSAARRRGKKLS